MSERVEILSPDEAGLKIAAAHAALLAEWRVMIEQRVIQAYLPATTTTDCVEAAKQIQEIARRRLRRRNESCGWKT